MLLLFRIDKVNRKIDKITYRVLFGDEMDWLPHIWVGLLIPEMNKLKSDTKATKQLKCNQIKN